MDEARRQRLSERAHAVWEREGRPEGQSERHWATAEEELRAEEQDQAGAPDAEGTAAASTARAHPSPWNACASVRARGAIEARSTGAGRGGGTGVRGSRRSGVTRRAADRGGTGPTA